MTKWNGLERRGGLRRTPFKKKTVEELSKDASEKGTAGRKKAHTAKKREKVDVAKRLDMVFSAFVRLRDAMYGGNTVCISCGRVLPFEQMQCGHFFSRRSLSTRWDEDNCNSECAVCNCHDSNHLKGYEVNLLSKIGDERFAMLKARHNTVRKWSDAELEEMVRHYTTEVRRLSKEKAVKVNI